MHCNDAVTCEIKWFLNNFWNYLSVLFYTCNRVWNRNKIISAAEGVLLLFQKYFSDSEHVRKCSWAAISPGNNFEIILFHVWPRHKRMSGSPVSNNNVVKSHAHVTNKNIFNISRIYCETVTLWHLNVHCVGSSILHRQLKTFPVYVTVNSQYSTTRHHGLLCVLYT